MQRTLCLCLIREEADMQVEYKKCIIFEGVV